MSPAAISLAPNFKGLIRSVHIRLQAFIKEHLKNEGRNYPKHVNITKTIFSRPRYFDLLFRFFGSYKYKLVMHSFIAN